MRNIMADIDGSLAAARILAETPGAPVPVAPPAAQAPAAVIAEAMEVIAPAGDNRITVEALCHKPNGEVNDSTVNLLTKLERSTRKGARKYSRLLRRHNLTLSGTAQGTELLATIETLFAATTALRTKLEQVKGFSREDRDVARAEAEAADEQAALDEEHNWD